MRIDREVTLETNDIFSALTTFLVDNKICKETDVCNFKLYPSSIEEG